MPESYPGGVLRFVGVVLVFGLGCDSFESPFDEPRQAPHGPPRETEPTDDPAGGAGPAASDVILPLSGAPTLMALGGASTEAPGSEPDPDPCMVAAKNGATFCEPGSGTLEYCVEAPQDGAPCAQYDRPPIWLYDLLIQCVAHCGVGIATSERELDGACCYVGVSEYYGR